MDFYVKRIKVLVKPNAKHEKFERINENEYKISVKAPPVDNKANKAVIEVLSCHFKIPKSHIILSRGTKGKIKIFEIDA